MCVCLWLKKKKGGGYRGCSFSFHCIYLFFRQTVYVDTDSYPSFGLVWGSYFSLTFCKQVCISNYFCVQFLCKAMLSGPTVCLNVSLFTELSDSLIGMISGNCFITNGRWILRCPFSEVGKSFRCMPTTRVSQAVPRFKLISCHPYNYMCSVLLVYLEL